MLRKSYYKPKAAKVQQQPESSDDNDTGEVQDSVEVGIQTDVLEPIEVSTQTDISAINTIDTVTQPNLATIHINEAGTQTDVPAYNLDAYTQNRRGGQ